jgi:hypothetical protein
MKQQPRGFSRAIAAQLIVIEERADYVAKGYDDRTESVCKIAVDDVPDLLKAVKALLAERDEMRGLAEGCPQLDAAAEQTDEELAKAFGLWTEFYRHTGGGVAK